MVSDSKPDRSPEKGTGSALGDLSPAKRALLSRLLRGPSANSVRLERICRDRDVPLSINQEGRFFLERLTGPDGGQLRSFNSVVSCRIESSTPLNILEDALNDILRRNEALRTTFVSGPERRESGESILPAATRRTIRQHLLSAAPVSVVVEDLGESGNEQTTEPVLKRLRELADSSITLEQGCLMRALVLLNGPEQRLLVLTVPHLLFDRASWFVFCDQLADFLSHKLNGYGSSAPAPLFQFADFADWQRRALRSGVFDEALKYWGQQWESFEDAQPTVKDLPFVRPLQGQTRWRPAPEIVSISSGAFQEMKQFAQQKRMTLYMLGVSAVCLMLHAYSGKERVAIWGHFANRTLPGTGDMMGWLANSHLLTSQFEPQLSVRSLLNRTREMVLLAVAHQAVPLPAVCASFLSRHGRLNRLFTDLYFSFDCVVHREADAHRERYVQPVEPPITTGHGVEIMLHDHADYGRIVVYYDGQLLCRSAAKQMAQDLNKILSWLTAEQETRTEELRFALQRS